VHKLFLPRLGQTMEEGVLARWVTKPETEFRPGDDLYEVETEKVTTEVQATLPGRLVRVLVDGDQTVPVGALLAVVADPGEAPTEADINAFLDGRGLSVLPAPEEEVSEVRTAPESPTAGDRLGVRAMPRTRALARQLGVDLNDVRAGRPDGLLREADVREVVTPVTSASAASSPMGSPVSLTEPQQPFQNLGATPQARQTPDPQIPDQTRLAEPVRPLTPVPVELVALPVGVRERERRILSPVARRMSHITARSWSQVPQFSQSVDVNAGSWKGRRDRLREETGQPIGYTDLALDALVRAVHEVPEANSSFDGKELVIWGDINVSVAVDTPTGLQVPVLHQIQDLSIAGRATQFRALIERARRGALTPDDVQGGTITLSNLGMYGVEGGMPMVTAPQATVVFVGAMRETVTAIEGAIAIRPVFTVVNGFDHRALDGATAARFTASLRRHMQGDR